MIKAVIFDFDGTIADTIPALCEGINLTMRHRGYPTHTHGDILRFINHGARELVRKAMPARLQSDEALVDEVLADYHRFYGEVYRHTTDAYDGIPALVERLHKTYKIAVLSNKQDVYVKRLCEQVLPAGSFEIAQGVIPGKPTKPDPFLSNLVAESLGVKPSECALVGDSDVDIRTAANAGMLHIGVSWGFRSEEFLLQNGARLIAHTPDEIERLLEAE